MPLSGSKPSRRSTTAAGAVAKDVAALQLAIDDSPDFSGFDQDIATASRDLGQAKADAAKAGTESDRYTACSDAYTSFRGVSNARPRPTTYSPSASVSRK